MHYCNPIMTHINICRRCKGYLAALTVLAASL